MRRIGILLLVAICGRYMPTYAEQFRELVPIEERIKLNSTVEKKVEKKIEPKKVELKKIEPKKFEEIKTVEKKPDHGLFQKEPVITKEQFKGKLIDLSKKRNKNGVIYAEGENSPYSGKFALFLGDFIEYTETYKDGVLEGAKTWYSEDGNIVLEETYKNSKIEGDQKAYYDNGKLKSIVTYKNGRISKMVDYAENGSILHQEEFKNGTGKWKYFWSNGNVLEEGRYKNWIKDGIWKKYREDGSIDSITEYKKGRLVETTWN